MKRRDKNQKIMDKRPSSEAQDKYWRQGEELKKPSLTMQAWRDGQQLLQERHEASRNLPQGSKK